MASASPIFQEFKNASEDAWHLRQIRNELWGFQFQPDTHWNAGLSEEQIREYQAAIDVSFPSDFCDFLQTMNGTDRPLIDVRGGSAEPLRYGPGFYQYPRDIELIRQLIQAVTDDRIHLKVTLNEQGFELSDDAKLVPIFAHRFVVCDPSVDGSPVLSIWDSSDAIVYGNSLREYLQREIFQERS